MAKIFGERSQYLILSDYLFRVGAVVVYFAIIYLAYEYFKINIIGKINTISGIAVVTILYGLVFYYAKSEMNRYTSESGKYNRGRHGEYEVYNELEKFPEEYLIFQDVKLASMKDANIDFVVVGPTGVYLLEVKSSRGKVEFKKDYERKFLGRTMNQVWHLHDYLKQETGREIFVNPVLVFSKASVRYGLRPVKNVYVIGKTYLKDLILTGKKCLSEEEIVIIKNELIKVVKK